MTWNNGNGQGNGYGQQQGYGGGGSDDVYERMNNAREQGGARFPFFEAGRHKCALVTLETFMHRTDGKSVRALFEILESTSPKHPPGSYAVKIFKIMVRPKYESSASDSEQLAHLCIALKDAPKGYPIGRDIRTLLEERPADQIARGSLVECTGVANQKGNWVNLYWSPIPQTPEQIVQMRQRIEAKGVPNTGSQQQGTQGAQYNNAPHPSQMQGQYPTQQGGYGPPPQTQYMPAGPQLPPGAQPGYGPTPQQQIQGAPNPAYYPNAAPQAPAGAPQGGFLAQLPPGPPQGGNGGGRW